MVGWVKGARVIFMIYKSFYMRRNLTAIAFTATWEFVKEANPIIQKSESIRVRDNKLILQS